MVDPLIEFAILLAVSVAAHMAVAYRFAPPLAIRRLKEWMKSADGQATLTESVTTHVLPAIQEKIESPQFGDALENWMNSPRGKEVIGNAVVAIAGLTVERVTQSLTGIGGNAAKRADTANASILLKNLAAIDLGSPVLNGLWSTVVATQGSAILRKISGFFRRHGFSAIDAEFAEVPQGESDEGPLSLAGGSEIVYP